MSVTVVPIVAQGAEAADGQLMGETQRSFPTGFQEVRVFSGYFRVDSIPGMVIVWVSWKRTVSKAVPKATVPGSVL